MQPLPKKQADGFKAGPNKMDQLAISALAKEGVKAEEISNRLKIKLESIKGWMPKPKKKAKTKKKED